MFGNPQQKKNDHPGFERGGPWHLLIPQSLANEMREKEERELEMRNSKRIETEERKRMKIGKAQADEALNRLIEGDLDGPQLRVFTCGKGFIHQLYSLESVLAYSEKLDVFGSSDVKDRKKMQALARRMIERGGDRELTAIPKYWKASLVKLKTRFPNFVKVLDYVSLQIGSAAVLKRAPRFRPLLLDGPPGCGKTMFCAALAKFLQSEFLEFHFETAQTSSELTGSDEHWSNSKVGRLFTCLVDSDFASPVALIDEVDKAGDTQYRVVNSLYRLLEEKTAATWSDLAMPQITLDVSRVVWILTSNNQYLIDKALRTRMKIFDIPALTTDQARAVANQIFAGAAGDYSKVGMSPCLPHEMTDVLLDCAPREMHRISHDLISAALANGRRFVQQDDFNLIDFEQSPRERSIGFV